MKKISLFLLALSAAIPVSAQKKLAQVPAHVEWADNPTVHPIPGEYKNEHAFFIINDEDLDYRVEDGSINVYTTTHWIVKVLDDKGIEDFNANGISIDRGTRVPTIRARTILPDGKINEITRDMIKVTRDEHGRYKVVFAMEGVEKNAEIEVLVKEIKHAGAFGGRYFQYSVPVQATRFEMSYPKDMVFEEKSFNGLPPAQDTLLHNRRHMLVTASGIPALKNEPNSFYNLHRMRCEYRMARFVDENENDPKKLFTWEDLGRKLYDEHCIINEQEKAVINKYLSALGVAGRGNEYEDVQKIENGIKNNIVLYPFVDYDERNEVSATNDFRSVSMLAAGYGEQKNILDSIISKKAASLPGYVKLFAACFTQAGIKYELGVAGNRKEHGFDSKFENWDNMDEYVFYFPDLGKFLAPGHIYCRCPVVPEELVNSKGVFCTIPPNGVVNGSVMEIRTIEPLAAGQSQDNIAAAVNFSGDMQAAVTCSYSGYAATGVREKIALQPNDKMKDLVNKMLPLADNPDNIINYKISNETFDSYDANKPLEISATINAPQLTEQAGKDYLFRLGDVIGSQGALYTTEARKLPVDLNYPYSLNRTITINVPKGYKVMNPEAIRLHAGYVDDKMKPVVSFNSDYSLVADKKNGDKLIVTVTESYSQLHFPVSEYERYRKVYNTSADFNKVTLLMQKKKG
jgi:hypothetical protein